MPISKNKWGSGNLWLTPGPVKLTTKTTMTEMFNLLDLTHNPNHLFPHTSVSGSPNSVCWHGADFMRGLRLLDGCCCFCVFFTWHGEKRAGFLISSLMKSHHESSSFMTFSCYNYSHNTISKCHPTEESSCNSNLGKGSQDWVHSSKWLWTARESGPKHLSMHENWPITLISVHKTWYNKRKSHKNVSD